MRSNNQVNCPLVNNELIDIADCIENVDVADGMIKEECMPDDYKKTDNWREVCKKCKFHNM